MKKEEPIKKKIKHKHKIEESDEGCPNCGYQEGYCEGCGKEFYRNGWRDSWKIN